MTTQNRIDPIPLRMSTTVTGERQTQDRGFGARVHMGLNQAAGVIVNAASVAGAVMGAPIVSAAVSQVAQLGGSPGTTSSPSVGGQYAGLGGGIAGGAFGTAVSVGPPGLVQSAVASSSGPIAPSGMGGLSSGLTGSGFPTGTSATGGSVLNSPLTGTVGGTGSAGGYQSYFSSLGQEQYRMLNLQIAMQQEYQFFATLSNVLKTRHDTVKAAISNIR